MKLLCLEPTVNIGPPTFFNTCHSFIEKRRNLDSKKKKFTFLKQSFENSNLMITSTLSNMKYGMWTKEEHENFLKGHKIHGNQWALIAKDFVKSRNRSQVASHAQKYFRKSK